MIWNSAVRSLVQNQFVWFALVLVFSLLILFVWWFSSRNLTEPSLKQNHLDVLNLCGLFSTGFQSK